MKKITILVAMILIGSIAKASENFNADDSRKVANRLDINQPIEFIERGIQFFVFANGDFDFNTRPDDVQGGYFYKTAGKRIAVSVRRPQNYGVLIEHDSFGRVRRIGNTFINYDFDNRVSRIGSVYMRYNRFALAQIGGLKLIYNRYGDLVDMFGSVKNTRNYGYSNGNNCNNNSFNNYQNNPNYYNQNSGNNSDYYYRNSNNNEVDSVKTESFRR